MIKVLTHKEEQKLSTEELKEYYKELRKYVLSRKLTNTTKGATTIAPYLKKPTNLIATTLTKALTNKNVEWKVDGQENIPEGTIILAHNHQGLLDNFIWIPQVKQHCLILHGQEVNKLLLLSQLNTGLVLVKKEDKESAQNAKLDMLKLLLTGTSLTIYPEGTWNLSPNKLHLPMSFGFLDLAKKTNTPVVPVVHEYTYDNNNKKVQKIHTKFGKPIYVNIEDDLIDKLQEYEETISTLKYELIEEKGLFQRKTITNQEYINYLNTSYKDLKIGKLDIDKERRNILNANDEFYDFFYINDIPYDKEGNLLEKDETIKIKKLAPLTKYLQRS